MKESTRYSTGRLMAEMRDTRYENGSALILAVVLTSLLAVLGVMFVMIARVDRIATSAISENKDLNSAVEAVIAKISQELVLDVPGMSKGREYYDYPDANNAWLASLEPDVSGRPKWLQISDVYDKLDQTRPLNPGIIPEYQDSSEIFEDNRADADGDGVADSKWVELDDMTSNKGRAIFAAIRVVDNGAMLNVNTAYEFDPTNPGPDGEMVDGSSQTQINLLALAQRNTASDAEDLDNLDEERFGSESRNMDNYLRDVVWRYYPPAEDTAYTPFDLSDELELRNRFILNHRDIDTRIETVWTMAFRGDHYLYCPIGSTDMKVSDWLDRACYDVSDPNADEYYSYRHIATTYNMDRIIRPDGEKMLNINDANAVYLYKAIKSALDPNFTDVDEIAAQIAVNLVDYRDNDSNVTAYPNPDDGETYYGFECPCVYISELAHNFQITEVPGGPVESDTYRSYGIELYKPYSEDDYPNANQWRLVIDNSTSPAGDITVEVDWSGTRRFHVIKWENLIVKLDVVFDSDSPVPSPSSDDIPNTYNKIFDGGSIISLQRRVDDVNDIWISVDSVTVPGPVIGGWLGRDDGTPLSIQMDITSHKCIRRLWDQTTKAPNLGSMNAYEKADSIYIQAHPENRPFTNIGEIGMLFRKDVYSRNWDSTDTEADVRLDLEKSDYHSIFKYLTVLDPSRDEINNDGDEYAGGTEIIDETELYLTPEFKIAGRININTAPWFVMTQLPWMQYTATGDDYQRAQKIVDSRTANGPYSSIGGLMRVMEMQSLGSDGADNLITDPNHGPDLTLDYARDDFEERDVIFARISNLVTVRSDVFAAYILVRIGADGPQKRVIAILDRSDVYSPNGKVRIVALHPVADPR